MAVYLTCLQVFDDLDKEGSGYVDERRWREVTKDMPLVATDNEDFLLMQRVRVTTLPDDARGGSNLGPKLSFALFSLTYNIVPLQVVSISYTRARLPYTELL